MKKLQNNFTTPEQSKRLLKLGVSADSANCYYQNLLPVPRVIPSGREYQEYINSITGENRNIWYFKPCWSALRLMEIIDICALGAGSDPNIEEYPSTIKVTNKLHISYIEYLVKTIERGMQLGIIDFSKLKD